MLRNSPAFWFRDRFPETNKQKNNNKKAIQHKTKKQTPEPVQVEAEIHTCQLFQLYWSLF